MENIYDQLPPPTTQNLGLKNMLYGKEVQIGTHVPDIPRRQF